MQERKNEKTQRGDRLVQREGKNNGSELAAATNISHTRWNSYDDARKKQMTFRTHTINQTQTYASQRQTRERRAKKGKYARAQKG